MKQRTSAKGRKSALLAALLALALAGAAAGASAAQPNGKERDQIWVEATLMDLRQRENDEQLLLMHTVVTHAQKLDATPESLREALEDTRRRAKGLTGPKRTRYRNVLRILGGGLGAAFAARSGGQPQIPFVAGTIAGEELDGVIAQLLDRKGEKQWHAMRREVDKSKLDRAERTLVERYRETLRRDHPELAQTGYGALRTGAGRPDDNVDEILERHPELRKLKTIIETKDATQRNAALLQSVQKGLVELDASVKASLDRQTGAMDRLGEEMKSERERRVEAELDRMKIEGLRGAAFVASTVIGWEDPKLAAQVGTVANAGIDVYEAIKAFTRLGEDATGIAAAALTGNVLAAVISVINVFIDTGPTPEQQILDAVRRIGDQVQALHERMEQRFEALDVQVAGLRAQIGDAVELIVANQRDTHAQLRSVRATLERHRLVDAEMLEALQRQTLRIETWFEDMHITPCLIHGEVERTMTPERFAECRNTIAAAGRSTALEGADPRPKPAEIELANFALRPDDMTNAGLQAFRAATVHEAARLPERVPGPERWTHVADRMDAFLSRWHELAGEADRTASTQYAATMRSHREVLRRYTEAVRRDLFRHATGRTDNAFSRTLEEARKAAERARETLAEVMNEEIEARRAHWRHGRQTREKNPISADIGENEIERIVNDLLEGNGRSNVAGAWDLKEAIDYIPEGWRGGKLGFARDLVDAIVDGLNKKQWQKVRYLLRAGLADIEVESWSWHHEGWTRRGAENRNGDPMITSWEDHRDRERLYDEDQWLWTINYTEHFSVRVTLTTSCRRTDRIRITARKVTDNNVEVLLDHSSDAIVAVRDRFDGERLADYAVDELEDRMEDYRRGRTVWGNACRREMRERFEHERDTLGKALAERLHDDDKWRRDNEAIDLAAARIKSWLRIALYDSAGEDANIEGLMNDTVTMRSPQRAIHEGETLWNATRRTSREEIDRFARMLATGRIRTMLRGNYGHEGIMRTLFVGIDTAKTP